MNKHNQTNTTTSTTITDKNNTLQQKKITKKNYTHTKKRKTHYKKNKKHLKTQKIPIPILQFPFGPAGEFQSLERVLPQGLGLGLASGESSVGLRGAKGLEGRRKGGALGVLVFWCFPKKKRNKEKMMCFPHLFLQTSGDVLDIFHF